MGMQNTDTLHGRTMVCHHHAAAEKLRNVVPSCEGRTLWSRHKRTDHSVTIAVKLNVNAHPIETCESIQDIIYVNRARVIGFGVRHEITP